MKILKLDPGRPPEALEISGDLSSMQDIVGGYIQAIYPFDDAVALICNEDGKLHNLEFNRALRNPQTGAVYDIVCGTAFLCNAPLDSEDFTDLTSEQFAYYENYYKKPEFFLKTDNGIIVLNL